MPEKAIRNHAINYLPKMPIMHKNWDINMYLQFLFLQHTTFKSKNQYWKFSHESKSAF